MAASKRQVTGGVDTHGKLTTPPRSTRSVGCSATRSSPHQRPVIARCCGGCVRGDGWSRSGWKAPAPTAPAWPVSSPMSRSRWSRSTGPTGAPAGQRQVRPDRRDRRARATLSGQACGTPKTRTGPVEAIRALRVARRGAVKARTAALNQLHGLIASAPEQLRAELTDVPASALAQRCAELTIGDKQMTDPDNATRAALHAIALRVQALSAEITQADKRLHPAVAKTAPRLSALSGAGPEVAGQLLATAGDNPDRLRSEAALAHLCGVAPIPASSGRTDRHRLNRGGDGASVRRRWGARPGGLPRWRWSPGPLRMAVFGPVGLGCRSLRGLDTTRWKFGGAGAPPNFHFVATAPGRRPVSSF
jgi:transposase